MFVEELLAHPQFRAYSLEDVERIVATNDKKRFKLSAHPEDGRLLIRASQGHSLPVCGYFNFIRKHRKPEENVMSVI